mgnify:FL=1
MPSLETLVAFFGVSVLLGLSPGPDNVFVLIQSAQRGWRLGLAVVLGLCLGIVVHTLAVALGLAAVFAASEVAFSVLKWCGAAYLVYLAIGAWRAPVSVNDSALADAAASKASASGAELLKMVGRGFVINLINPKVLIFFLAFLPQFANPALGPVAPQIFVFGAVFILSTFLVFGSIAIFSGVFGNLLLRSEKAQWWLNKLTAIVFVGLALRLATSQR